LSAYKYNYARYDGSLSLPARAQVLNTFKTDKECTVLLMSLKSGSLGLNLVCASRIIMLDPWWYGQRGKKVESCFIFIQTGILLLKTRPSTGLIVSARPEMSRSRVSPSVAPSKIASSSCKRKRGRLLQAPWATRRSKT